FRQRGYSKTSIEDIAEGANFAPRTFFLHFKSKEDLLFPDADLLTVSFQAVVANRGASITALEALKQWMFQIVGQKAHKNAALARLRKKIIDSDELLRSRQ